MNWIQILISPANRIHYLWRRLNKYSVLSLGQQRRKLKEEPDLPQLKVTHICTYANGGAGIAAWRIHEALLQNHIESTFLCVERGNRMNLNSTFQIAKRQYTFSQKAKNKFIRIIGNNIGIININSRIQSQVLFRRLYPLIKSERITLPFAEYDILSHPSVQNADIIHLHWVGEMLDYPGFFSKNIKPVIWTLHDMNPFRGLFHYMDEEILNEKISKKLDKNILALKQKVIEDRKCKLSVVSPSVWLLKNAKSSSVFNNLAGYVIPNPINTEVFFPIETKGLREQLNIPGKNIIFLFVAQFVTFYRKGFDILSEALNTLKDLNITVLIIGNAPDVDIDGVDVKLLGSITETEILREYYSLADAIIIPSREDNLPNVMLEAMACGTPVLCFNVGGLAEVIEDGFNGLKAGKKEPDALANIIREFIISKNEYLPDAIHNFAKKNFSYKKVAEQYKDIYKSVLN
jgi:glycosyltransferase involved in cell wall biosynthesis